MDEEKLETDREKFVRLAKARVEKAMHTIRLIGNLSNASNYHYTTRDVDKIFSTLESEIKECRKRFEAKQRTKPQFVLDDEDEIKSLD